MESRGMMLCMNTNDDLKKLIQELAEANEALLQVAADGDSELIAELLNRVSLIERRRNRALHRSAQVQRGRVGVVGYESSVSLRDQVIRALQLVSSPATGRLLADITKARWEEQIDTTKLSSLRRDESRSWTAAQDVNRRTAVRDVYVVPALSYDRFAPVRGTLALSTWETSRRLITPLSPRVDMLKCTIALARESDRLTETRHGDSMRRLVGRLSASIPGVRPFGSTTPEIIEAAEAELAVIEENDAQDRAAAAERANKQLDSESLLFGAPLRTVSQGSTVKGR